MSDMLAIIAQAALKKLAEIAVAEAWSWAVRLRNRYRDRK